MSRIGKLKARMERAKVKAKRKAEQQARWQALDKSGTAPRRSPDKHRHATAECGNVGCARCFPTLAR